MLYLTMFVSAFLAATFLPFASELTLVASLAAGGSASWLIAVATLGNTLGAVVNWGLGRFMEQFRDRSWFPVDSKRLQRGQAWFRALRSMVAAARLGPGRRRCADRNRRCDAGAHRTVRGPGGGRQRGTVCRYRVTGGECEDRLERTVEASTTGVRGSPFYDSSSTVSADIRRLRSNKNKELGVD